MAMVHRRQRKTGGFTLLELIVTVAILALIACVAMPSYMSLQDKARQGVAISYAGDIAYAINIYNVDSAHIQISSVDWSSRADMISALGVGLAPTFSNEAAFLEAVSRVEFVGGIAKVNTTIR